MNRRFILVLLVCSFIFVSCGRNDNLERRDEGWIISYEPLKITRFNEMEWRVGLGKRKKYVSKGLIIRFEIPRLSKSDLETMVEELNINSWLVKVSRRFELSGLEVMGSYYIPFQFQRKRGTAYVDLKDSLFKVYYAAAAMSNRLANLPCPAFDHDKKIDDIEVEKVGTGQQSILIRPGTEYKGKVDKTDFIAVDFNAGMTMLGQIVIQIAPYNYNNNQVFSELTEINARLNITDEETVSVPGCQGYQVPTRQPKAPLPTKLW